MDDPYAGQTATVERLLSLVRTHLGMDVAWLSEISATEQVFLHVDTDDAGFGPSPGDSTPLEQSYCIRVLDGRLPGVIPDSRRNPATRHLPATEQRGLGSYVGTPVTTADGTVRGMLCCAGASARPDLGERDRAFLELLAGVLGELHSGPGVDLGKIHDRVIRALAGEGRSIVLQPIVDVLTGTGCGAEALSRFATDPYRPDVRFAEAERVGLRPALELAAATDALQVLHDDDAPGYLSVNLSPDSVLADGFADLFDGVDLSRVVVEITEHAAVGDYGALRTALAPHRTRGLSLAVDDAGAGYASFRHIVELQPDQIKVDISLVRDVDSDPVKQALTLSLVQFARAIGASLVAEGVETQEEYDTVAALGVSRVQGYLLARPGECAPDNRYRQPTPGALRGRRPRGQAQPVPVGASSAPRSAAAAR